MFGNFLKPVSKVTKRVDKFSEVVKALDKLKQKDVLIGIPQETSSRSGDELTNAELGFILAHGSPIRNIPPRPFLDTSLDANKELIAKRQAAAIKDALDGKIQAIDQDLGKLGMAGQNIVKDWFTNAENEWPPNAPSTIARKGSDKPLIDTGQLRNSITYVIRDKNAPT